MTQLQKKSFFLALSICALALTLWFESFIQKNNSFIEGGLNRVILFFLINFHSIIISILLYYIIRQSIKLFLARKKEIPGSVFSRNLLFAFITFSVIPTIFVFFVVEKLITTHIDNWFRSQIDTGLHQALNFHNLYTGPIKKKLLKKNSSLSNVFDLLSTGNDTTLQNKLHSLQHNDSFFKHASIYLWNKDGEGLCGSINDELNICYSYKKMSNRSNQDFKDHFLAKLTHTKNASENIFTFYGSLYCVSSKDITLSTHPLPQTYYLVIAYRLPPYLRSPLIDIETSLYNYHQITSVKKALYWHYLLLFLIVTLLIVLLSIWCAFYLAQGISKPLHTLLKATENIKTGNWNTQVPLNPSSDLNSLAIAFNAMTDALKKAREQLEYNNKEILLILEHVNASVFFIGPFGRIMMFNSAARKFIATFLHQTKFKNKKVSFFGQEVSTLVFSLIRELKKSHKKQLSKKVDFTHNDVTKTCMIHLTWIETTLKQGQTRGLLVVVEDMTDLLKINKIKIWQEAAQQLAHEIKNPLTPIQLATQFLNRKYRKSPDVDPLLLESTETILNQVHLIRNLVAHFSSFARMPEQRDEIFNINDMVKEIACLYQVSYPDILFTFDLYKTLPTLTTDKKKLKRVIINVLDNAVRALTSNPIEKKEIVLKTRFKTSRNQIEFIIADNGPGIPHSIKDKLFLPYISTEKKNTGLGLAIVRDTLTQLQSTIKLIPSSYGASFQILLPIKKALPRKE